MPNGATSPFGFAGAGTREAQVADFKRVMREVDDDIALVCLCGNHDVGDRPNKATVQSFTSSFGDDYFAFNAGGCRCLVCNSSLQQAKEPAQWEGAELGQEIDGTAQTAESVIRDRAEALELAAAQDAWLEGELQGRAVAEAAHTIIFTHIPPFTESPDEPKGYFNYDPVIRAPLLATLKAANVSKWFCGHYHRNAGGWDGGLEVVVSSAYGAGLARSRFGSPGTISGPEDLFCIQNPHGKFSWGSSC
jgi:hypothetical protein